MTYVNFQAAANFNDTLFALLSVFEAPHHNPQDVGDGDITIGLGFNLNKGGVQVQDAVFEALGLRIPMPNDGGTAQQGHQKGDRFIFQNRLSECERPMREPPSDMTCLSSVLSCLA